MVIGLLIKLKLSYVVFVCRVKPKHKGITKIRAYVRQYLREAIAQGLHVG